MAKRRLILGYFNANKEDIVSGIICDKLNPLYAQLIKAARTYLGIK